jgi:hypothetical protein
MPELDPKVLLAWGRDFHQQLETHHEAIAAHEKSELQIPTEVLRQFLTLALGIIERYLALNLDATGGKRPRHRPKGTGMGAHIEALVATGVPEEDAVRSIAEARGSTPAQARKALQWHRRPAKASEAPPKASKGKVPKKSSVPEGKRRKTRSS